MVTFVRVIGAVVLWDAKRVSVNRRKGIDVDGGSQQPTHHCREPTR